MVRDLAKVLMNTISTLPFTDKIGGVAELTSKDSRQMLVACDYIQNNCQGDKSYTELVPSVDLKSLFYFENERGAVFKEHKAGDIMVYETEMRLVGWINQKRLGYNDENVTSLIISSLIKRLLSNDQIKQNISSPFLAIRTTSVKEDNKDPRIFTKHGYKDNFRFKPYDYFSITFGVKFFIDYNCLNEFVVKTPLEC